MGIPLKRCRHEFWTRFCERTSKIDPQYAEMKPAKTDAMKMGLIPLQRIALWFIIRSKSAKVAIAAENRDAGFNRKVINHVESHRNTLAEAIGCEPETIIPNDKNGRLRVVVEFNHNGTEDPETWDDVIDEMVELMQKFRTVVPSIFDDFIE